MNDVDVTMPQLGETVSEGTVLRWLHEIGASVAVDEPLLEVSTDKVDTEVVAPTSGILRRIVIPEGETVPVGTVLAQLGSAVGAGNPVPAAVPGTEAVAALLPRHQDSPLVRRLARDRGVDLAGVTRTGRHGRATRADVLGAAAVPAPAVPAPRPEPSVSTEPTLAPVGQRGRVEPLSRRRKVIAERMHRSLQETAQLTTVVEVDLGEVTRVREVVKDSFKSRHGASLSVLAFVAEAAVRTLAEHPIVNARLHLDAGTVTYPGAVDLGIAVDTPEGLVVPVIRGADDLNVGAFARRIAELATRVRSGLATADELTGGTFTITNTGSRGALFDTPILNAPQSAILGLGAVVRRPVALRGEHGDEVIAIRSMAYLALTYDHRLIDGADAARFLGSLKRRIETPGSAWVDVLAEHEGAA